MPRRKHHYEHMLPEMGDTSHLTPRQRDVVDLMRRGYNEREIAELLEISLDTVRCHTHALRDQFDALSGKDLIIQFFVHGILEKPARIGPLAILICTLAAFPIGRTTIRTPANRPKVAQVMRVGRHEIAGVVA